MQRHTLIRVRISLCMFSSVRPWQIST